MIEGCSIRAVTSADLPLVLAWRNHPDIRRHMFSQHEISLEEHRAWFDKVTADESRVVLLIEQTQVPLGYVQFTNVSTGGVADWGFYARPGAPKGSGRKIGRLALGYAFESLALHKVCGQAIERNEVSIAFHKSLGFKLEGVLREQRFVNGEYHTLICFGVLDYEWRALSDLQD